MAAGPNEPQPTARATQGAVPVLGKRMCFLALDDRARSSQPGGRDGFKSNMAHQTGAGNRHLCVWLQVNRRFEFS